MKKLELKIGNFLTFGLICLVLSCNSTNKNVSNFEFAKMKTFDGKELTIGDFKNKILIIEYWSTGCGPCLKLMPYFAEKQEDALQVLKWNVLLFPNSIEANRNYIFEFLDQKGIKKLPEIYDTLYKVISSTTNSHEIVLWFSQWLCGLVNPLKVNNEELKLLIGDYGPRHIFLKDGNLYYYRNDRPEITNYKLIKAFIDDDNNPVFILDDNSIDYFRIKFVMENGEVEKLVGQTIYGGYSESVKE